MAVKLSAETQKRIERLVNSGEFSDAEFAVAAGLSLLERDDPEYWDQLESLDEEANLDRELGRVTRADDAFIQSLRDRVNRQIAEKRRA